MTSVLRPPILKSPHLLAIDDISPLEAKALLDLADTYVEVSRQIDKRHAVLQGRTQVNLFFEASTRTQSSFEIAGKRLGADVMNMAVATSAISKGETVLDTAMTINAMHPDFLVVRHQSSGAVELLADQVDVPLLRTAIREGRKVAITYRSEDGRETGRVIWPIAVAYFDARRLIISWCELRQAFGSFRTGRMLSIVVNDEKYPARRKVLLKQWQDESREREGMPQVDVFA